MEPDNKIAGNLRIGFVVVRDLGEAGYIGGYLCINERGVPIEFWHTTDSPIKVTRLQRLMYGKTLMPELLGRHIAGSLLGENRQTSPIKPLVLFTEEEDILRGFNISGIAIALVNPYSSVATEGQGSSSQIVATAAGDVMIQWKREDIGEAEKLIPQLKFIDVLEPFERKIGRASCRERV